MTVRERSRQQVFGVALWVLAVTLASSGAYAQTHGGHGEFERLVHSAVAHYEAHEARAAIEDLERAFAIRPVPRLLYNLGRAHEQAGDWAAAADYYQRFLESHPDPEAATVTQEALDVARRRMAEEQAAAAQRASALAHARDMELARQQAAADALRRAELNRQRAGVTVATTRRVRTPVAGLWIASGVAAAAGGVLVVLALQASNDFPNVRQDTARSDLVDRGNSYTLGCDIALGTAAIAAAVGLVLYFLTPPESEAGR